MGGLNLELRVSKLLKRELSDHSQGDKSQMRGSWQELESSSGSK